MNVSIWNYKSTVLLGVDENLTDNLHDIIRVVEQFEIRIHALNFLVVILYSKLL
jgi:hypothetical protein